MTLILRHTPPYDKTYMTTIDAEFAGTTVLDFYTRRFRFMTREQWADVIASGVATVNGLPTLADQILCPNDLICTRRTGVIEPPVNDRLEVLHDENGLFVINKPAPLPVHPSGRYWKNTLTEILKERDPARHYHPIYRLDSWTTGVLVMATNPEAARILHRQVVRQQMKKTYAVLACNLDLHRIVLRPTSFVPHPTSLVPRPTFFVDAPIGRIPGGVRSTRLDATDLKAACTEFTVLAQNGDVTLLKAVPITGRTNQIRVHLQHVGAHVLGDPLYGPAHPNIRTYAPTHDFMALHCREMCFEWPPANPCILRAPWPEGFLRHFDLQQLDYHFA